MIKSNDCLLLSEKVKDDVGKELMQKITGKKHPRQFTWEYKRKYLTSGKKMVKCKRWASHE